MCLSKPQQGKTLAFDGRLLHGAPKLGHFPYETGTRPDYYYYSSSGGIRVTFLANCWLNFQPCGVDRLPDDLASHVKDASRVPFKYQVSEGKRVAARKYLLAADSKESVHREEVAFGGTSGQAHRLVLDLPQEALRLMASEGSDFLQLDFGEGREVTLGENPNAPPQEVASANDEGNLSDGEGDLADDVERKQQRVR